MSMGESWVVNSSITLKAYLCSVEEDFYKHKYLTFKPPSIGPDRSIDQNSLFHLWCSEWVAHKLGKHYKTVDVSELSGMKRTVKKIFYIANPDAHWMVHVIKDYTTGNTRKDYTSSSDWKTGEMFQVLEFMQLEAAMQGVILESKGKFAQLQRSQN